MKFYLVFAIFVSLFSLETLSQKNGNNSHDEAFAKFLKSVAKGNHVVSVILGEGTKEEMNSDIITATVGFPHVVSRFNSKCEKFTLNSTAVVSLFSVKYLELFNNRASLLSTFSMQQQLIIFLQNETFEHLGMLATSRKEKPIIQHEYFVIEEKETIRLLTFLWYLPGMCYK